MFLTLFLHWIAAKQTQKFLPSRARNVCLTNFKKVLVFQECVKQLEYCYYGIILLRMADNAFCSLVHCQILSDCCSFICLWKKKNIFSQINFNHPKRNQILFFQDKVNMHKLPQLTCPNGFLLCCCCCCSFSSWNFWFYTSLVSR